MLINSDNEIFKSVIYIFKERFKFHFDLELKKSDVRFESCFDIELEKNNSEMHHRQSFHNIITQKHILNISNYYSIRERLQLKK